MIVKIFGAGSIGNHLAHACRSLGWQVDLCDINDNALERTQNDIYPGRYGAWDENIRLFNISEAPKGEYDLIVVGTPPDSHLDIALDALQENPKALLIEKPLCRPDLEHCQSFWDRANASRTEVFVGYDHAIGKASKFANSKLSSIGKIETIDVEFREHWGGIFLAHPWLDGPKDSYLGYWQRGGGALGEHSHALHLWQHFAKTVGAGKVIKVSAQFQYNDENGTDYDSISCLSLTTENGMIGRVVQDVVTKPTRKWGRIQGTDGAVEWHAGEKPGRDDVIFEFGQDDPEVTSFSKTRPDDFIQELKHIEAVITGDEKQSPISLESGLDTMLVIAAAHKSAKTERSVKIDYDIGYHVGALSDA